MTKQIIKGLGEKSINIISSQCDEQKMQNLFLITGWGRRSVLPAPGR